MKSMQRKTERLIIRPMELNDYDVWKKAQENRLPPQNIWDQPARPSDQISKTHFQKMIKNQQKQRADDQRYELGVFTKKEGALIGHVSIMDVIRNVSQSSYLGYFIFNSHWGQGLGSEAVQAMIDIAFKELHLHRIEAGIESTNRRSIQLALRLGFHKEGLRKKAVFLRGHWVDLAIYAMTCEDLGLEWKPQRSLI